MSITTLCTRNLFTLGLALLLLSGCGGSEPTGTVTGTVKLDGQPVTAGEIGFISAAGFSAIAEIGSDGSFTVLEDMPVGKYSVTVTGPSMTEAPGEEGGEAVAAKTEIPEGYFDEGTTDLTQEIATGPNTVTIELKKEGPPVIDNGEDDAP